MLACRGQRRQILAKQLPQLVLIIVADDDRLEVGRVAEAFLVNLHDAVIAHVVQRRLHDGLHARVMAIQDGPDGIVVVHLGRGIAVGEERAVAVDELVERRGVTSWRGEVQVRQLEHGLHVLDRRGATDALALGAN